MTELERRAAEYAANRLPSEWSDRHWLAGYRTACADAAKVADDIAAEAYEKWKNDPSGLPYSANRIRHVGWDAKRAIERLGDA